MPKKERPYVICHMGPSIDGRIVAAKWPSVENLTDQYNRIAETFEADAWIVGRVSMAPYAGKATVPRRKTKGRIPRKDFIAVSEAQSYAIAIDASGKLAWKGNSIDEDHVITILSERVPDDYLAFLQSKRVSYLFGGRGEIDLKKVLEKLRAKFAIRRLLLEGGGKINGSFLAADLIDELSVVIAPIADGSVGTPTLFDVEAAKVPPRDLQLIFVESLKGDLVWLRYRRVR
jgi:2,5-diamino-6-(ribosylamino)-4(3H)-pyrimidinone 5'-phosphate reductase